jgi:hypothetical protein
MPSHRTFPSRWRPGGNAVDLRLPTLQLSSCLCLPAIYRRTAQLLQFHVSPDRSLFPFTKPPVSDIGTSCERLRGGPEANRPTRVACPGSDQAGQAHTRYGPLRRRKTGCVDLSYRRHWPSAVCSSIVEGSVVMHCGHGSYSPPKARPYP